MKHKIYVQVCDICSKETQEKFDPKKCSPIERSMHLKVNHDAQSGYTNTERLYEDICEECADKIAEFIENINEAPE